MTIYSFCEASTAGSRSRWHIRPLTEVGRKLGGGVDTPSLCGHVDRRRGGWDREPEVLYPALAGACPECREAYIKAIVFDLFRTGPVEYPFDRIFGILGGDGPMKRVLRDGLKEPLYRAYFAAVDAKALEGMGAVAELFAANAAKVFAEKV